MADEFFHVVDDYGADNTGATSALSDIQAAIDAANAAGGGIVYFPAGTYTIDGTLALKTNVKLLGTRGAQLRKTTGAAESHMIEAKGTLGAAENLSANAALGAETVTVASPTALDVGDYVLIRDNSYEVTNPPEAFNAGRNQEINRIASITHGTAPAPTTITLATETISAYTTAQSAQIIELNAANGVAVEGLTLEVASGVGGGQLYFELAYDVIVKDCLCIGPSSAGSGAIGFSQSALGNVTGCDVRDGQNVHLSGNGYGLIAVECHHIVFQGNRTQNVRENAFSWGATYCSFIDNVCLTNYDSGFNTHGAGCRHILIANNIISGSRGSAGILVGYSGSRQGDFDVQVLGNIVRNVSGHGIYTRGKSSTVKNQRVTIANNEVADFGTNASSYGIWVDNATDVDIIGNRVTNPGGQTSRGIIVDTGSERVTVANNRVGNLATSGADGIALVGATKPTRVTVTGNQVFNVADQDVFVDTGCTYIIVAHNLTDSATFTVPTAVDIIKSRNIWGTTAETT